MFIGRPHVFFIFFAFLSFKNIWSLYTVGQKSI